MDLLDKISDFFSNHWFELAVLWMLFVIGKCLEMVRKDLSSIADQVAYTRETIERGNTEASVTNGQIRKLREHLRKSND